MCQHIQQSTSTKIYGDCSRRQVWTPLQASLAEPPPSRWVPGGLRRGKNTSDDIKLTPNPNTGHASDRQSSFYRESTGASQLPPVRSASADAGDVFVRERMPLQERLQLAPSFLRERAIDLRDDVEDRVFDIRVRCTTLRVFEVVFIQHLCTRTLRVIHMPREV